MYEMAVREDGPTAIEYALIAGFLAIAIIAALILLGGALSNIFGYMGNTVNNSTT
jgi:Flp pilus assembly pilin Flp